MGSITCGNCRNTHETAADVRACYAEAQEGHEQQQAELAAEQRYERWLEDGGAASERIQWESQQDLAMEQAWGAAEPEAPRGPMATERQISYLADLQAERLPTAERQTPAALAAMSKQQASLAIGELLKRKPLVAATRGAGVVPVAANDVEVLDVPAGRYAVEDNGTLKFYKVDVPGPESKWHGRTFVKVMASDTEYPVKGAGARRVLSLIARDPKAAMLRYGMEIGSCGHCGRTLTNEDSRAAGIGPICAGKMGW